MMDTETLLNILGNENRRKILQLLATRPCYVSEIAERLNVGPKAIIGHLEVLEQAGMIEGYVDEQRRKYYHITNNLMLEVLVSPYTFGFEMTMIDIGVHSEKKNAETLTSLSKELSRLKNRHQEIVIDLKKIQAAISETMETCMGAIEEIAEDSLDAEILYALLKETRDLRWLSINLGIHEYLIEERILKMVGKGIIKEQIENNTAYFSIA